MDNSVKYHSRIVEDARLLLDAFKVQEHTIRTREDTISKLRNIIQNAGQDEGEHWEVEDVSGSGWVSPLDNVPLELVVVDRKRPHGLSADYGDKPIPSLHDHNKLASLLLKHDFNGSFVPQPASAVPQYPILQTGQNENATIHANSSHPWPSYQAPYSFDLMYPATLYVEPPDCEFPFYISPASPVHSLQNRVLQAINDIEGVRGILNELVDLVWTWLRSHGVLDPEVDVRTVTWMVVAFLRHQNFIPDIFDTRPESRNPNDGPMEKLECWVRQDPPTNAAQNLREPRYATLAVEYVTKKTRSRSAKAIPETGILFHLFHSWLSGSPSTSSPPAKSSPSEQTDAHKTSSSGTIPSSQGFDFLHHIISPREGGLVERTKPLVRSFSLDEESKRIEGREVERWYATEESTTEAQRQTEWFTISPVVVRDPVLTQFNRARTISRETWFHIISCSSVTAQALGKGFPLVSVFGDSHGRPDSSLHLTPNHGIFLSGNQISPRQRVFGQQNRAYHSNAVRQSITQHIHGLHGRNVATPATLQKRSHTVQKIQNIIHKRYGRKYQLEVFGSTRYGVDTESSDLDLVIIDPDRILGIEPHIFRPKFPEIYNPRRLADVLRREQFTNIQAIPFASVPIVKFHDPDTGIQGDININHQLGLFNTHLLAAYCNIYPNLRVLIRAVKTWAKSHGLNEPSPKGAGEQTSFSSYALTLMIVVFLQVKGVIPNLQSGLPPFDPTASTGLFWLSKKGEGKTACDVRFRIPHDWVPSPSTRSLTGDEASVGDLLVEWFRFWGWEADYGRTQASIKHGGFLPRSSGSKGAGKIYANRVQHDDPDSSKQDPTQGSRILEGLKALLDMQAESGRKEDKKSPKGDIGWKANLVDLPSLRERRYEERMKWIRKMDEAEAKEILKMTGQTSTEMQSVADEANGGGVAANPVDGNEVVVDKPAEAKDTIEEMESVNGKDESDDEVALGSASDHEDLGEWEATEAFPDELGSTFHPSAPPFTITSGSTTISHAPPPLPVPSQPSASQLQGKAKGKDKGKRRRQEARRSPSPAVPIDPAIHVDSSSPESLADRWPSSSIVVIDPFIMSKNVTRGENELVLSKFISECRRAVVCLDELGGSFESLLGDGSPIRIGNGESRASRKAKERKAAKEAGAKDKDAAKEKKDKGKGKGKEQENETKEKSSSNSAQPQPVSAPAPAPVHSEPGPSQRKAKEDHSDQSRTELNQWPDTRAQSSGRVRAQEATSSTTIPRNFAGLVSRALADIGAGGVPVRGPVLGRWVPPSQRPPVRRPNSDAPVSTTNTNTTGGGTATSVPLRPNSPPAVTRAPSSQPPAQAQSQSESVSGVSSGTATRNRRRRRRVVRGDAAAANSDVQSHPGPETQGV